MEPNDTCEIPVDTDNTDVDLEIPKAIKAPLIPTATLKTSPEPMYSNEYFEIAKSNVAGWGAFAMRDLTKGDVILREIPLFVAETDKIFHEFYKLDESAKKVALSLHSHRLIKGGTPQILAVWQTNWQVPTASINVLLKFANKRVVLLLLTTCLACSP